MHACMHGLVEVSGTVAESRLFRRVGLGTLPAQLSPSVTFTYLGSFSFWAGSRLWWYAVSAVFDTGKRGHLKGFRVAKTETWDVAVVGHYCTLALLWNAAFSFRMVAFAMLPIHKNINAHCRPLPQRVFPPRKKSEGIIQRRRCW